MNGEHNAGSRGYARITSCVAAAAVFAVLFVPAPLARSQRDPASRPAAPAQAPRAGGNQAARPPYQNRPPQQPGRRPQPNAQRPGGYGGAVPRPPGGFNGGVYLGPNGRSYAYPGAAPAGHLSDWLNRHGNLPPQEQERVLRNDPGFQRLNPGAQQRLIQQLHQVNQMPEAQRQRRLARGEMIERLSPQQRMQINMSGRRWAALPPDRQAMMKDAFRDLRAVPLDQRQMVLNSSLYQSTFTPEERGILSDFLSVEPYEPGR